VLAHRETLTPARGQHSRGFRRTPHSAGHLALHLAPFFRGAGRARRRAVYSNLGTKLAKTKESARWPRCCGAARSCLWSPARNWDGAGVRGCHYSLPPGARPLPRRCRVPGPSRSRSCGAARSRGDDRIESLLLPASPYTAAVGHCDRACRIRPYFPRLRRRYIHRTCKRHRSHCRIRTCAGHVASGADVVAGARLSGAWRLAPATAARPTCRGRRDRRRHVTTSAREPASSALGRGVASRADPPRQGRLGLLDCSPSVRRWTTSRVPARLARTVLKTTARRSAAPAAGQ